MASNKHLINNFIADKETKDLALELLHVAKTATVEGSGRALGSFAPGLPAVCMLIASERLNAGDVTESSAQAASCLKKKDFKKACDTVRAALEERERSTCISYHDLYTKYKVAHLKDAAHEYVMETENELIIQGDQRSQTTLFRCAVFFWVFNTAKLRTLRSTEQFAATHSIPLKSFVRLLDTLNLHAKDTKSKISKGLKSKTPSPTKSLLTHNAARPPHVSTNASSGAEITSAPENETSPTRRSGRINDMAVSTPSRQSPRKQQPGPSVTKIAQPPRFARPLGGRAGPLRELPSKGIPKKRAAEDPQDNNVMGDVILTTPAKKPKFDSTPAQPIPLPSLATTISPVKKKIPLMPIFPAKPAPLSELVPTNSDEVGDVEPNPFLDASDSENSNNEDAAPTSRFRPVYLEHKQWCALDPRLARFRRKGNSSERT